MSKIVNYDHAFTQEEREYLLSRAREHEVTANDRMFGPGSAPAPKPVAAEAVPADDDDLDINELTVAELKAELDEAGVDYPSNATKHALQELVLKAWSE